MRKHLFLWPIVWLFSVVTAVADARISVLVDVLKLPEAAVILSEEGLAQADELNKDMLNGQGGAGWAMQVSRIYEPALMVERVRTELEQQLTGDDLEEVITFYASTKGTEIIELENAARRAIQDQAVEDAARGQFTDLDGRNDPRQLLIEEYIATGDMISRNVTSALNSNYQFLRGMVDGDAFEMSESEMLKDAAGEMEESMRDTREWLNGFLLLAYHPLSDDDLRAYIAFAKTPAGEALNRALFDGFGKAYEDISYALGQAVARNMLAEEL